MAETGVGAEVDSNVTITVLPLGISVRVGRDVCLLDGLRAAGWHSPYKCRRGGCGACKVRLAQGVVSYKVAVATSVLSAEEVDRGLCLPCRAYAESDVALELGDGSLRPMVASLDRLGSTRPRARTSGLESPGPKSPGPTPSTHKES